MKNNPYLELKVITDQAYAVLEAMGEQIPFGYSVASLLHKYGIRMREEDGKLTAINISIPKSTSKSIVVGLRYLKRDNTKTEDLFLFKSGHEIIKGYKARLEKVLPEYYETHKLQR